MLLVIDVGNTETSVGVFSQKKILSHWRIETNNFRTCDEYASLLFPLFQNSGMLHTDIQGIAICSVVPQTHFELKAFCENYLKKKPYFVEACSELGFGFNVDFPSEVGADRLANVAYAVKKLALPAIVIDLGTATTFDVISDKKIYEGGIILPGIRMGAESLSRRTSLLPVIDVKFPPHVLGKNTVACMQSGILFGYCDAIDGLIKRLEKEVGKKCDVFLTGGLAQVVHRHLKTKAQDLPNLTLEGIKILYELNPIATSHI